MNSSDYDPEKANIMCNSKNEENVILLSDNKKRLTGERRDEWKDQG